MNIYKYNNEIHQYESIWRSSKEPSKTDYDTDGNVLPWPKVKKNPWYNMKYFIEKLKSIEHILFKKNNYADYLEQPDCLICGQKNISNILWNLNNIHWDNGLAHYINAHYYKPSYEFIDIIYNVDVHKNKNYNPDIINIPAISYTKHKKKYIKLNTNQIHILDALYEHGGFEKKYLDKNKNYRYSEHSGLLDFNLHGLEKVIVSAIEQRHDKYDDDILLPQNIADAYDYEYIFHTHPPTPYPGARAEEGVLYEMPSINDIFHFIEHYNNGMTQGSIIIAPEGMYIIRKKIIDDKKIHLENYNATHKRLTSLYSNIQKEAISEYGTDINIELFYNNIAQNIKYIKKFNNILNTYDINIDYKPRQLDKSGRWVIKSVYLPVYVIEPKNNI